MLINKESWDIPPIFPFLQQAGNISEYEMMRTFNNGIGMIAIVPDKATENILQRLTAMNENAFLMGEILECKTPGERIIWV